MRVSPLLAVALVILVGGAECASWFSMVRCITSKLGYRAITNRDVRWVNRHASFTPATPLLIQNHRVSPITNHVHRHHSPHSSPPILISHTIPFPPTPCHSLPFPPIPSHTLTVPPTSRLDTHYTTRAYLLHILIFALSYLSIKPTLPHPLTPITLTPNLISK